MIRVVLALALGVAAGSRDERLAGIEATRGRQNPNARKYAARSTFPGRVSSELEAAKGAAPAATNTQVARAPAAGRRLDDGCPDAYYVYGTATDSRYGDHEGSYINPIDVVPGCPWTLEFPPGKAQYLRLTGMNETNDFGSLPMLLYSWAVVSENGETPINLFSNIQQPAFGEVDTSNYYDWYYWPLLLEDVVTFREDTSGGIVDYYHYYGFCSYNVAGCSSISSTDLRTIGPKTLYISVSNALNAKPLSVTNLADVVYTNRGILEAELNVIKTLYAENCHPWNNAPAGWTWEDYMVVESDAIGEADPANKPYCDWWPGATIESVNALGVLDCLEIPGVLCDGDGHVADLIIDTKGLRGPLPSSFDELTHLVYIELQNNRFEGPLPTHIFDSSILRKVDLYGNGFTGTIPCPTGVDPDLIELSLANNQLSGVIPNCLFEDFPELTIFDVSRNLFESTIPTSMSMAAKLTALFMQHAGLTGPLDGLSGLPLVASLDVSHNFLTGEITQEFVDGMPAMYRIDLSWNQLTGPLPTMDASDGLRRIHFDHNMLSGTITDQFTTFAENQDRGALSELYLQANGFCGDLPEIFYTLLMDSHYFIYDFDVVQNHFRCSIEGNNKYWPSWAMSIPVDFGMCIPIPVITEAESAVAIVDRDMPMPTTVYLAGMFTPTTEGKCKFTFSDGTMTEVPAVFESTMRVACDLPLDAPVGETSVTVAHYCSDYASAETLADYVEVTFVIQEGDLSSGSSKKKTKTNMAAIIGGVVAGVVALLFLIFIFVMCCRERAGKPLFKPLKDTENPLYLDDAAKSTEKSDAI